MASPPGESPENAKANTAKRAERTRSVYRRCVRIRAKELVTVKMDHVGRVFGDPNFGFPSNGAKEGLHHAARAERCHKDKSRLAPGEKLFEFFPALAIHRPGAGDSLNKQKPVPPCAMNNHIWHLGSAV
jgi:hypothetical protein